MTKILAKMVAAFALALALPACGGDEGISLDVELVTSIVPRAEFSYVQIENLAPAPLYEGATRIARVQTPVTFGQDFVHGLRVATFENVGAGEHVIQVRLLRADLTALISRRVRVTFDSDFVLRVHMTPDCVGVTCPSPAGSPALSECLAGHCVDERCIPPNGEFCPEVSFCNTEADCPAPLAACATRTCDDGICGVQTAGSCAAGMYCDPASGCVNIPDTDAGIPDAGVDAGEQDAASDDGGVVSIDGALCGVVCVIPDDPCHAGIVSCATGVATCVPYVVQPVGSACGENKVCDVNGVCSDCTAGAACSIGCLGGTIRCGAGYAQCDVTGSSAHLDVGAACSSTGACVEGSACGTGDTCSATGECVACVDARQCTVGCEQGHTSCASGGECQLDSVLPPGSGCGETVMRDHSVEYTGYCDATSTCLACTRGEDCESSSGCASGHRRCDDVGAGVGVCESVSAHVAASACAAGVGSVGDMCDGADMCVTPLLVAELGSGGFDGTLGYIGSCAIRESGVVTCFDDEGTYDKEGAPLSVKVDGTRRSGCVVSNNGELWCWTEVAPTPTMRPLPSRAVDVVQAASQTGALGVLLLSGELAYVDGTSGFDAPIEVLAGVDDVVEVGHGASGQLLARRGNGQVIQWGTGLPPAAMPDVSDATGLVQNSPCLIHGAGTVGCAHTYIGSGHYPYGFYPDAFADIPLPFTDIVDATYVDGGRALCALRSTHEVFCFGSTLSAGHGPRGDFLPPTALGLGPIDELSGGCVRRHGGELACWTANTSTSDSDLARFSHPTIIAEPLDCVIGDPCPSPPFLPACYSSIISRCEGGYACSTVPSALGDSCAAGQCDGTGVCYVPLLAHSVAVGIAASCAIRTDGTPVCWGTNSNGALGDPSLDIGVTRGVGPVVGVSNTVQIASGLDYACALRDDGTVQCWGAGNATATSIALPEEATHIAANAAFSDTQVCVTGVSRRAHCWTSASPTPTTLPSVVDAVDVAGGFAAICFTTSTGEVQCVGNGGSGALGDGTFNSSVADATTMQIIDDAAFVAVGPWSTCVLRSTGEVWCTGYVRDTAGEGAVIVATPERVVLPFTDARQLALGYLQGYVLRADGTVWSWQNDPTTVSRQPGLVGTYEELIGGSGAACAASTTNGVFCGYPWSFTPVAGP